MNEQERKAVLAVCLLAALADGAAVDREREEIKRIALGLAGSDAGLSQVYQDVLLKRVTLADVTGALTSSESKQLAYEMAVCACDADGPQNDVEKRFLGSLRESLGLDGDSAAQFTSKAERIAAGTFAAGARPSANEAEVDQSILDNAIVCAALEQLPQSLATMAIVPLQMRMVYRVGKRYGFELDRGHVVDFIATAGLGLTAQVVDGFARKLVGGVIGRALGGGFVRGLGVRATGSAVAFTTTYALGHLAKRYYAGGRKLSKDELKSAFDSLVADARGLQAQHASDIARRAANIDLSEFVPFARGA